MTHDFKKIFSEKVFISKEYNIRDDGTYYVKFFNKNKNKEKKARIVYISEDLFYYIYDKTSEFLGEEETKRIWINAGYNVGIRSLAHIFTKEELSEKNYPHIFETLSDYFYISGLKIFDNPTLNKKEKSIVFFTEKSAYLRKENMPYFLYGLIKGIFEEILENEHKIEILHNKEKNGFEIISKQISEKKINSMLDFFYDDPEYFQNFSLKKITKNYPTLLDLIKFKIIKVEKNDYLAFKDSMITPIEIGSLELIYEEYKKIGQEELLDSLIISFFINFLKEKAYNENLEIRMKDAIRNLFSYGFGKIEIIQKNDFIEIYLQNPTYTKFGDAFFKRIIIGIMHHVFETDLFITNESKNKITLKKS